MREFLKEVQKWGSKDYHITHCLGARDAWKWVRKNKWDALKGQRCSSSLYGAIVDKVNQKLVDYLLEGHHIYLPHQMGSIELIATPTTLKIENGEVKDNYRTDWRKTLRCWYEESDARKERLLIKRRQNYKYSIRYSKAHASYKNQRYYLLRLNRSLVRKLGYKIENEKLNTKIY